MTQQDVKKAFMYPPRSQNEFLELNKNALNKIGYDVQPTDLAFVKYMGRLSSEAGLRFTSLCLTLASFNSGKII